MSAEPPFSSICQQPTSVGSISQVGTLVGVGVTLGGTGVLVNVFVGGTGVLVNVFVGGTGVLVNVFVGGTGVLVNVFVGGTGVLVKVFVGGTGVLVGVLVGASGAVVNVNVELVALELPSLATAYHSYCVPAVRPDQVIVASDPEGTVVVPISVKGAALSNML